MTLDVSLVGTRTEPMEFSYTWRDTVTYALGVGAKTDGELGLLFEAEGPKVLPSFAVVPSFAAMLAMCVRLKLDLTKVVHGEQTITMHKPIPVPGSLATVAEVKAIYDKGKGAVVLIETTTVDAHGTVIFDNRFSVFVRGAGGFGGDRGPETVAPQLPDRPADIRITEATSREQAALYRLSGDYNPLHISPSFAQASGFERPILHGLCTYGYACRALVAQLCGGDPTRLHTFAARFSAPVVPGDELTTSIWKTSDTTCLLHVTNQAGTVVLSNGTATLRRA